MFVREEYAIDCGDLTRLESSIGLNEGWLEDIDDEVANGLESLCSGYEQIVHNSRYQKEYPRLKSTRASTSFSESGFVSPSTG